MAKTKTKLPQTLDHMPYFHRWLHRSDTKDVLEENGDFVLRKTKIGAEERLAISVYWLREIRHFPIQKTVDGRFCFESRAFRLVRDLIRWHQTNCVPLTEESGAILKVGKSILEWELTTMQLRLDDEEIAMGRYGDVYEGRLLLRKDATERMVAVKTVIMDKGTLEDDFEEGRESLLHEARCLREVSDHSNIVKFFGVTIDTTLVKMAVELMSGNLFDRLKEKPTLTPDAKLKLLRSVIAAVAYVHCHGMIHRHICAKNCLVLTTESGETVNLKLTGFDFCEKLDPDGDFKDNAMPPLNVVVCAPESLSIKLWTKTSDVWSIAVFAYELYNDGAAPYANVLEKAKLRRAEVLLAALQKGTRLQLPTNAPEPIKPLWKTCFDADPKRRPSSFELSDVMIT